MHLGLEGKTVLVTGGTKSIGRAIVEAFLEEGAIVHFCARNSSDVKATTETLNKTYPDHVFGKAFDVAAKDSTTGTHTITTWVDEIASSSPSIDVIVSNVSALNAENTPEAWDSMYAIDMLTCVNMVQAATPHLEKSHGNIIAISSVSGRDVDFTAPGPYGAFKAALVHYMAQLAHVLASKGVRANTVSPGNIYVKDGVWGGIERDSPDLFKMQMEKNPMGRMGRAEEIAAAVVFLASARASFVSGTNLVVDGALCTGVQL